VPAPPQQLTTVRGLLEPPTAPGLAADDAARPAAAPDCSPQAADDLGRPAVVAPCRPPWGRRQPCEAYCSGSLAPHPLTQGGLLQSLRAPSANDWDVNFLDKGRQYRFPVAIGCDPSKAPLMCWLTHVAPVTCCPSNCAPVLTSHPSLTGPAQHCPSLATPCPPPNMHRSLPSVLPSPVVANAARASCLPGAGAAFAPVPLCRCCIISTCARNARVGRMRGSCAGTPGWHLYDTMMQGGSHLCRAASMTLHYSSRWRGARAMWR
jgi:hypothetical protein